MTRRQARWWRRSSRAAPETEWHRTTADPAASIGRWRRDLTAEARQACEQALASELQIFGYATEEAVA